MGSTVTELETLERETRLVRTAFEVIHELDDDRRERCVKLGTSVLLAAAERVIECNAAHAGLEVLERFEAAPSDAIGKAAWVQVLGEVRERLHESAIAEPLDDTEQIATDDAATPMTESHAPLATVTSAEPEVSLHDHGQMIGAAVGTKQIVTAYLDQTGVSICGGIAAWFAWQAYSRGLSRTAVVSAVFVLYAIFGVYWDAIHYELFPGTYSSVLQRALHQLPWLVYLWCAALVLRKNPTRDARVFRATYVAGGVALLLMVVAVANASGIGNGSTDEGSGAQAADIHEYSPDASAVDAEPEPEPEPDLDVEADVGPSDHGEMPYGGDTGNDDGGLESPLVTATGTIDVKGDVAQFEMSVGDPVHLTDATWVGELGATCGEGLAAAGFDIDDAALIPVRYSTTVSGDHQPVEFDVSQALSRFDADGEVTTGPWFVWRVDSPRCTQSGDDLDALKITLDSTRAGSDQGAEAVVVVPDAAVDENAEHDLVAHTFVGEPILWIGPDTWDVDWNDPSTMVRCSGLAGLSTDKTSLVNDNCQQGA